ncbi:unnamed protein product [Amoebophrya sp. A120]|nr:unnamed protein product [Amoebophrya sp. A120]|eukprot:GSA120T00011021001.1
MKKSSTAFVGLDGIVKQQRSISIPEEQTAASPPDLQLHLPELGGPQRNNAAFLHNSRKCVTDEEPIEGSSNSSSSTSTRRTKTYLQTPLLQKKQHLSAPGDLWRLGNLNNAERLFRVESKLLFRSPTSRKRASYSSSCGVQQPHSYPRSANQMSRSDTGFMTALVGTAALSSCIYGLVLAATNASVNFIHLDFETCGTAPDPAPPPNSTYLGESQALMSSSAAVASRLGLAGTGRSLLDIDLAEPEKEGFSADNLFSGQVDPAAKIKTSALLLFATARPSEAEKSPAEESSFWSSFHPISLFEAAVNQVSSQFDERSFPESDPEQAEADRAAKIEQIKKAGITVVAPGQGSGKSEETSLAETSEKEKSSSTAAKDDDDLPLVETRAEEDAPPSVPGSSQNIASKHRASAQTLHALLDKSENLHFNCPRQTFIQQVSVAAVLLGAGAGSLLGGPYADRVGRRGSMLRLNCLAVVVFLACAFSQGWYTFIGARFFAGLTIGAVSVAVPMYIAEVCPDELRGKFGVAHQLLITIGIMVSDALGLVQSQDIDFAMPLISRSQITHVDKYWWRVMLGFACLPSLMSIILWGFLLRKYESPVWLVRSGKREEATTVMKSLMPKASKSSVDQAVDTIQVLQSSSGETKSFWWALQSRYYRVGAIIGCILSACQQTSGINVMITQSTTVFLQVANYRYATLLTTLTGVLNVVVTLATIPMIERLGRRNLLLISGVGTTLSMGTCLLSVVFKFSVGIVVPVMIMCFIMSFAVGWGPVVWIYLSDIYPAEIKGSCFAHAIMVNWFACAVVVFGIGNFLSNNVVTYSTFTILNILGLLFITRYVVETKGSSVEDSPIYQGRERDPPEVQQRPPVLNQA